MGDAARPLDDSERRDLAEIAQEDDRNQARNQHLRTLANWIAAAMAKANGVERVVLFGSVARPPTLTLPYARRLRRYGKPITRACDDLDLAVEVSDLSCLRQLQTARNTTVNEYSRATGYGVANHMVDVFILEPDTGRYLGRLCQFRLCPKPGKIDCIVRPCGDPPHLRIDPDFSLYAYALAPDRSVVLIDLRAARQQTSD